MLLEQKVVIYVVSLGVEHRVVIMDIKVVRNYLVGKTKKLDSVIGNVPMPAFIMGDVSVVVVNYMAKHDYYYVFLVH